MAITQTYVDYGAGNDTTGNGSVGTPWKTIQKALDTVTRNATDGDQINVKAGTAQVLGASLTLATYGTPTAAAPLLLRGYTSAANDGGIGEIDCGGATMWASGYDYLIMRDLDCHTFGDNHGINIGGSCYVAHCRVHKGASSPSGKTLVKGKNSVHVTNCYLYDAGGGAARGIDMLNYPHISGNFISLGASVAADAYSIVAATHGWVTGNIVRAQHTGAWGLYVGVGVLVAGNVFCNLAAGTKAGLMFDSSTLDSVCRNNIIMGWSGSGGKGLTGGNMGQVGYNAFYNNATNYSFTDQTFYDLTAGDVALAANPFTDAANGDFSLTDAAKAALRSLGWPSSYLGAHANSDPHITIGPMQYGPTPAAAGGGFPILGGSVLR